jgi:hypothetical protein
MANEQGHSQFNMALATLERLNNILIIADKHYRSGKMWDWFFALKSLKMQVIGKLDKGEREKLKTLEGKIINNKRVRVIHKIKNIEESYKEKLINNAISKDIESYNELLQDLMERKKLTLPNREDETIFA